VVIGNPIWNTFYYCNLFQISTKFELTGMCSSRLIATTIANPPELNFGQEGLNADLQFLHYNLVGMHKITPKIQEVMEFKRWLIDK
jgi:hypothetical protein